MTDDSVPTLSPYLVYATVIPLSTRFWDPTVIIQEFYQQLQMESFAREETYIVYYPIHPRFPDMTDVPLGLLIANRVIPTLPPDVLEAERTGFYRFESVTRDRPIMTGMGVTIPTNGSEDAPVATNQAAYHAGYHIAVDAPAVSGTQPEKVVIYVLDSAGRTWLPTIQNNRKWITRSLLITGDLNFEKENPNERPDELGAHGLAVVDTLRRTMLDNPTGNSNPSNVEIVLVEVLNAHGYGTVTSFMAQLEALEKDIADQGGSQILINMSFVFDLHVARGVAGDNKWLLLSPVIQRLGSDGSVATVEDEAAIYQALLDHLPFDAENMRRILQILVRLSTTGNISMFAAAGSSRSFHNLPFLPAALPKIRGVTAPIDGAHAPDYAGGQEGHMAPGEVVALNGVDSYATWRGTSFACPIIVGGVAKMILQGSDAAGATSSLSTPGVEMRPMTT